MSKYERELEQRIAASKQRLSFELMEHVKWLEEFWKQTKEKKVEQLKEQWDKDNEQGK